METPQETQSSKDQQRQPAFNIATVVLALIVTCVGIHLSRVYLLTQAQDFALLVRTAFIPIRYSGAFEFDMYALTSPVTYSLLHGDGVHLAINMIWLAAFGSPLANRIGTVRFLAFWIFTAACAVLFHYLLHADDPAMVIGASGAVSGMMASAARFGFRVDRSAERPAFTGPRLGIAGVIGNRTVVVFLAVWFVINLVAGAGFLLPGEARSIAWEAHIGGFAAGFFLLGLFDRKSNSQHL